MNFALHISCMVEERLSLIQRPVDWTQADEAQAYERCLKEALEENGRAWADGNIRVGDYILLSMSLVYFSGILMLINCSRFRHPCARRLSFGCLL